jgi:hypothetical protein
VGWMFVMYHRHHLETPWLMPWGHAQKHLSFVQTLWEYAQTPIKEKCKQVQVKLGCHICCIYMKHFLIY